MNLLVGRTSARSASGRPPARRRDPAGARRLGESARARGRRGGGRERGDLHLSVGGHRVVARVVAADARRAATPSLSLRRDHVHLFDGHYGRATRWTGDGAPSARAHARALRPRARRARRRARAGDVRHWRSSSTTSSARRSGIGLGNFRELLSATRSSRPRSATRCSSRRSPCRSGSRARSSSRCCCTRASAASGRHAPRRTCRPSCPTWPTPCCGSGS